MMFVALAIEGFAEIERLLLCTELNFHRPAGAVDRGELAHVRLLSAQMGQHEVPTVAEQTFRSGILAAVPGFLTTHSPPSRRDFRVRAHGHEAALFALFPDDGIDVDDVSLEAFEQFFQGASIR